jgi:hypothetical protein
MDHEKARARAKVAANARWKKHRAGKSLAIALSEMEKAIENLQLKVQTVATISGEPYSELMRECIESLRPPAPPEVQ